MRLLLNIYLFIILISLVWVGHERFLRLAILFWMCSVLIVTIRAHRKGAKLSKKLFIFAAYFLPALVASCVAIFAKLTGMNNEWANGVLEIWVHPFFPILELIPAKEMWGISSTFLLSCFVPLLMLLIIYLVHLFAWEAGADDSSEVP